MNNMAFPARCPICESPAPLRPFIRYEMPPPQPALTWVKCNGCTGAIQIPYLSELKRQKDPLLEATYTNYLESDRPFWESARNKVDWVEYSLLSRSSSRTTLFEIGPGIGTFAQQLRKTLPQVSYFGLESRPDFAKRLQTLGFAVTQGSTDEMEEILKDWKSRASDYNLFFLDNVLEHLENPLGFLRRLKQAFGRPFELLIEVPNEAGLRWRTPLQDALRGQKKPPTFPGHINLFTKTSLTRLVQAAGALKFEIHPRPVRTLGDLQYLTQRDQIPAQARFALKLLGALPLDQWLGVSYWLRATALF